MKKLTKKAQMIVLGGVVAVVLVAGVSIIKPRGVQAWGYNPTNNIAGVQAWG